MSVKATRFQTKNHNNQLILKTIYHSAPISRAAVARSTLLTRPTVSSQVNDLIESGIVVEVGVGPSEGGKPPTLLDVDSNARNLICVDIGNQEFRGAILNLRGKIQESRTIPAENITGNDAVQQVYKLIDELVSISQRPILGIGIGTPGLINPELGIVRRSVNLDWTQLPLRQLLEERYQLPIHLGNDSQVAALAEFVFGRARDSKNVILIKVGQGIGSGIVLDGSLVLGDGYGAGEIGQVVVENIAGNLSTLEAMASTRSLIKKAQKVLGFEATWSEIVEHNSKEIKELLDKVGHYLGIAVANLIAAFNIHHIIISGRVSQIGESLLENICKTARQYTISTMADETTVEFSSLGNEIVLLGCSALILKNELGIQ
ncbi:MAG: ROK family transcriptional regulator [Chloroflexota bacterium]